MQDYDWRKQASLLDMQPNNRRFVQAKTPRTLREAGWTGWGDEKVERRVDEIIFWGAALAMPFVLYRLAIGVFA